MQLEDGWMKGWHLILLETRHCIEFVVEIQVKICGCEPLHFCDPNELTCECGWHSNLPVNLSHRQPSCWYSVTNVGVCISEKIWFCWGGVMARGIKKRLIKLVVQHSTATSGPRRRNQYICHLPAWLNQDSLRKQLISFFSFNIMTRLWC